MPNRLSFPKNFIWGTSTASYQIETAFEHDWKGVVAKDGFIFDRTADHEKRFKEDADLILNCSNGYRMSMQWSKLQRAPYAPFHQETVDEYIQFIEQLKSKGCHVMLVLHHFTDPLWFVKEGKWDTEKHIDMFLDYVTKFVYVFGKYADTWNTFNEPNVFVSNGWVMGEFPPFKKNLFKAFKVIKNLGIAHNRAYDIIKAKSTAPIGISHNTVCFVGEHFLGKPLAKIFDWWFMDHCAKQFEKVDFLGMSYYAKMPFVPYPLTYIEHKDRFEQEGRPHDGMWQYYPKGMYDNIKRYWNLYKKPIIITESGVCTEDDEFRQQAMKDYLSYIHKAIEEGVDIKGYFWWSTFDNFEWNLGCTYRFGLYRTDFNTMERIHTKSVDLYHKISSENCVEI
jgi:beta-glucosidase